MGIPAMKLDYTLNVPTLVGGLAFVFTVGGAWASISGRVAQIELIQTQSAASIAQRNALYEPKIEALQTQYLALDGGNRVQDNRIENLAIANREINRNMTEILSRLATIREDIAGIKASIAVPTARGRD